MKRVHHFNWTEKSFFLFGIMASTLFFVWAGMLQNPPSLASHAEGPNDGNMLDGGSSGEGAPTISNFYTTDIGAQVYRDPDLSTPTDVKLPSSYAYARGDGLVEHSTVATVEPTVFSQQADGTVLPWHVGTFTMSFHANGASTWRVYTLPDPAHVPLFTDGPACGGDNDTQRVQPGIAGGEFAAPGNHTITCNIWTSLVLPEDVEKPIQLIGEVTDIPDDGAPDLPPPPLSGQHQPKVAGIASAQATIKLVEVKANKDISTMPVKPGIYAANVKNPAAVPVSQKAKNPDEAFDAYKGTELASEVYCKKELYSCTRLQETTKTDFQAFTHEIDNRDGTFTCVPTKALIDFVDPVSNARTPKSLNMFEPMGQTTFVRDVQVVYPKFTYYNTHPTGSKVIEAWANDHRKAHEEAHVAIEKEIVKAAKPILELKMLEKFEDILKKYGWDYDQRLRFRSRGDRADAVPKAFTTAGQPGICAKKIKTAVEEAQKELIGLRTDAYDPYFLQNASKKYLKKVEPTQLLGIEEHLDKTEDKGEGVVRLFLEEKTRPTIATEYDEKGSFDSYWHLIGGIKPALNADDPKNNKANFFFLDVFRIIYTKTKN